ncbi:MAG: hypothetical protein KA536_00125 [Saprospiraceae bacterium]|nr:hypothetical protein [Saprospiraceae bacterium]
MNLFKTLLNYKKIRIYSDDCWHEFEFRTIQDLRYWKRNRPISIGKNVTIGYNVSISADVRIGENVTIGDKVSIHDNVEISDNVEIGYECIIQKNVIINKDVKIGSQVLIQKNSSVDENSTIRDCVKIYKNVRIGRDVYLAIGSGISCNVIIRDKAYIGPWVKIEEGVTIKNGEHISSIDDQLQIKLPKTIKQSIEINIYNDNGNLVLSEKYPIVNNEITIDTFNLQVGNHICSYDLNNKTTFLGFCKSEGIIMRNSINFQEEVCLETGFYSATDIKRFATTGFTVSKEEISKLIEIKYPRT